MLFEVGNLVTLEIFIDIGNWCLVFSHCYFKTLFLFSLCTILKTQSIQNMADHNYMTVSTSWLHNIKD